MLVLIQILVAVYYLAINVYSFLLLRSQKISEENGDCSKVRDGSVFIAAILGGALRAASLNVLVNTRAMGVAGAPLTERCLALLAQGEAASDAVFMQVKNGLL